MAIRVHPHTPRVAVACGCTLGEEVVWDPRTGSVIWVDIEDPAVWRHWPDTGATQRLAVAEKIGFALLTPDPGEVLAGFKSGVVALRLSDGTHRPVVRPDPHPPGNRLNGGSIGPDGILYFSSMDDAETSDTGSFHRWDGRNLHAFGGPCAVTNGPVVSPDGRALYTIDTARGIVRRHALHAHGIGEPEPLIVFEPGWGHPDGLTLDADGYLWICHYAGSRVTRFAPDGSADLVLPMPTALVTKCAFGGPGLSTLYVTTCRRGAESTLDPMAGHLFSVETRFRGALSNIYGAGAAIAQIV